MKCPFCLHKWQHIVYNSIFTDAYVDEFHCDYCIQQHNLHKVSFKFLENFKLKNLFQSRKYLIHMAVYESNDFHFEYRYSDARNFITYYQRIDCFVIRTIYELDFETLLTPAQFRKNIDIIKLLT